MTQLAQAGQTMFPDSIAVNEAVRTLVRMSGKIVRATPAPKKRGG